MVIAKKQLKKGFGLLEVLISAVIIIMILSALVIIGRRALANSAYLQQRAQAIYLAQEGIEIVRQMRDTNWIDGNNATQWDTLAPGHPNLTNPDLLGLSDMKFSLYSPDYDRYNLYEITDPTIKGEEISLDSPNLKFYRYVKVTNYPKYSTNQIFPGDGENVVHKDINALKVTVYIEWDFGGGDTKKASVSEILTNWRPNF